MLTTFHPYPDFECSIACLDDKRLRKLLQMTIEILEKLDKAKEGERLPPGVKMWKGHTIALVNYGCQVCREMSSRGFTVSGSFNRIRKYIAGVKVGAWSPPEWVDMVDLHKAHRAWLLKKNRQHYSKFKWRVSKTQKWAWPNPLKLKNLPVPVEWTLDELLKAGWRLRVKWSAKQKGFIAWFWTGPMEEVPLHKVYGLYCHRAEQAIRVAIREFQKEMS